MGFRIHPDEVQRWQATGLIAAPHEMVRELDADISEKAFQSLVVECAKRNGWLTYHTLNSRGSEKGFLDLVLCHAGRGKFLLCELKSSDGRVSVEQKCWIQSLIQCGINAKIFRPCHWPQIVELLEKP